MAMKNPSYTNLILSSLQTNIDTFENSVDQDEPSHIDFRLKPLFATMDGPNSEMVVSLSETQGERVHVCVSIL